MGEGGRAGRGCEVRIELKVRRGNNYIIKAAGKMDKSAKYVVHCQSGYRARIAYRILKNLGFDIKVFGEGGYGNFDKIGVKTVTK